MATLSRFSTISLFLVFFATFIVKCLSSSIVEVVVLKYDLSPSLSRAQRKCPLEEHANLALNFGFCICTEELLQNSQNPTDNGKCKCHRNLIGKSSKIVEKCPHWTATYSQSCLSKPDQTKCLTGRMYAHPSRFVYVRVGIDDFSVTNPEWQSLVVGRKSNTKLATTSPGNFITLSYSVQNALLKNFSPVQSDPSPVPAIQTSHTTKEIRTRPNIRPLCRMFEKWDLPGKMDLTTPQPQKVSTTAMLPSSANAAIMPTPAELLRRMGNDINQIREFLLAVGRVQKIHALSFDVAGFKQAVIEIHNRYRWHHEIAPLSHDSVCEGTAKNWADNMANRKACLSHSPRRRFGENLFFFANMDYFTDPRTMAEAAVHSFYMEGRSYNYGSGHLRPDTFRFGHFTQMVWKSSRKIGVGVTIGSYAPGSGACMPRRLPGYYLYIVMHYDPPGNVLLPREYASNVGPVVR
ncbi:cysteine-rich secretory protein family domain-containing protein [Ditylenchus destructor]|nr:cysteine-rich secretory protein family domain-containing protein [Ditylenchus destructor]